MTTPIVTTGGPAPAGIYWQAVILRYFNLVSSTVIGAALAPTAVFELATETQIAVQPPQPFTLLTAAGMAVKAGTHAAAQFDLETTTQFAVHASQPPVASFKLSTTTSFSTRAAQKVIAKPLPQAFNAAVTRAATI